LNPNKKIDWSGLGRAFLFFWFFSGVTHSLLLFSGATGSVPFRQGVVFSLLWLIPLLLFPKRTRVISAAIGGVLWLFSLINLGYFAVYGQEFSQSVLFIIFESNPAEASEYLGQYFVWWMIPFVVGYSAIAYWLWQRVRRLEMAPGYSRAAVALIVIVLIVPPSLKVMRKGGNVDLAIESIMNRMEPAVPWQFVIGLIKYKDQLAHMQVLLDKSQSIPPIANLVDQHTGKPATIVMVIGESTNRQHMSLYGYARKTSPELEAMRDQLTVFNQVYASRPYTIEALQQVLTFADQENPNLYLTKPSLMAIMKQAGYKTYWITNQQTLTKRNTMLTNFSEQMDEQVYLNHQRSQNSYSFDGSTLEPFQRILQDGAERKFIVIHLLGTHMRYKYRFPPEYEKFEGKSGLPAWVTDEQAPLINEYDNAVLYNDFVLASLIKQLGASKQNSMLMYFSDHGEDVYDWPNHDFIGRNEAKPTPPMYAIPFFLWASEEWKKADLRRFEDYRDRTYQISHLIHTWADLTGLRFDGYDPTKSVINPAFKERPILVGDPGNPQGLIDLRTMLKK
jgi:heptose-I-phosphate ethanolaminephosphotransferase